MIGELKSIICSVVMEIMIFANPFFIQIRIDTKKRFCFKTINGRIGKTSTNAIGMMRIKCGIFIFLIGKMRFYRNALYFFLYSIGNLSLFIFILKNNTFLFRRGFSFSSLVAIFSYYDNVLKINIAQNIGARKN